MPQTNQNSLRHMLMNSPIRAIHTSLSVSSAVSLWLSASYRYGGGKHPFSVSASQ